MKGLSKLLKLPMEYYIVFILFIVVLMMSVYGGGEYTGYSSTKSLDMYKYENFQNQFSQQAHSAAAVDGREPELSHDTKGVLGIFEAEGLKASPIDASPLVDPVSSLNGSPGCIGASNGYSNSLGGLCLTEDVKRQFQTRGGNQATGPAQIG